MSIIIVLALVLLHLCWSIKAASCRGEELHSCMQHQSPPLVLDITSLVPISHLIVGMVTRFMTTPTSHWRESVSPGNSSPRQLLSPDPALERTVVLTTGRGRPGRGRGYHMSWLPTEPLTATHSGQRWKYLEIHCFPVQRLWLWSGQCPQYMCSSFHPGYGGG